jgi:hypothetical protein
MFLLSSGTFEREIIEVEPYAHLFARFWAYTSPRVMLIRLAIGATGPIRRRLPSYRHRISVTFFR